MIEKRKEVRIKHRELIKMNGSTVKVIDISDNGVAVEAIRKPENPIELDFGDFKCTGTIRWILTNGYGHPMQVGVYVKDFQKFIIDRDYSG